MSDHSEVRLPWMADPDFPDSILSGDLNTVLRAYDSERRPDEAQAALRRTIVCVNALGDIPTEAIEQGGIGALFNAAVSARAELQIFVTESCADCEDCRACDTLAALDAAVRNLGLIGIAERRNHPERFRAAEPAHRITVTRRFADYHAHVDDNRALWAAGHSPDDAIGNCVRTHAEALGLSIVLPGQEEVSR